MAWHSYDFYEKRKNDPKWRDAWIFARDQRRKMIIGCIISVIIISQITIVAGLFWNYSYDHDISNFNQEMLMDFLYYVIVAYRESYKLIWDFLHDKFLY